MSDIDKRRTILMADDDAEDCQLVRDALRETGQLHDLRFVRDGEELFDYLRYHGEYEDPGIAPRPDIILLDLKMPRKDGREVLREIKSDAQLRVIPVIVLTTSTAEDDILASYDMGVNSYITKPVTFRHWVEIVKIICEYWFDVAALPSDQDNYPTANFGMAAPEIKK
jgi:CheY-like chemotaxis protein